MDARGDKCTRAFCNTRLVRRLFAQYAPMLSGSLPKVLDAYEAQTGAAMLDEALAEQVRDFARSSPEIPIACDEFLGLIEDIRAEAPADASDVSVAHSDSFQSVFSTRSESTADTSVSIDDGDAALRAKLIRSTTNLERLHNEYDALLEHKHAREAQLEAQIRSLRRRTSEASTQNERHEQHAAQLERRLAELEHAKHSEHEEKVNALTEECDARTAHIDVLQSKYDAYCAEALSLRETASAQEHVISRLEETIALLENALEAAENVHSAHSTYNSMSAALELERSMAEISLADDDTSMSEPPSWPEGPETLAQALSATDRCDDPCPTLSGRPHAASAPDMSPTQTVHAPRVVAGVQTGYYASIGTQTERSGASAAVQAAPIASCAAIQAAIPSVPASIQTEPPVSVATQTDTSKLFVNAACSTHDDRVSVGVQTQSHADLHAGGKLLYNSAAQTDTRPSSVGIQAAPTLKSAAIQTRPSLLSKGVQHESPVSLAGTETESRVLSANVQTEPTTASVGVQAVAPAACTATKTDRQYHSTSVQSDTGMSTTHATRPIPSFTPLIFSMALGMWAGMWLYHATVTHMSSVHHALVRDDSVAWFDAYLG